jgi:hypothetical protein
MIVGSTNLLFEYTVANDNQIRPCYHWNIGRDPHKKKPLLPNPQYKSYISKFHELNEKIEHNLLIGIILPERSFDFDFTKLADKEVIMHIDKHNMHHLFQDSEVCEVINAVLDSRQVGQLEYRLFVDEQMQSLKDSGQRESKPVEQTNDQMNDELGSAVDHVVGSAGGESGKRKYDQMSVCDDEFMNDMDDSDMEIPQKRPRSKLI